MRGSLFPYLVVLFVIVQFVRAMLTARKQSTAHEGQQDETEEQRRMREVQERIRKKIAERRGGAPAPVTPPANLAPEEPRVRPTVMVPPVTRPIDPFGGAVPRELLRRVIQSRTAAPQPAQLVATESEVLARQQRLAEEMRALESARRVAERKATQIAAEAATAAAAAAPARDRAMWVADLRHADSVRRAIVLREVLGTPVGLR